MHKSKLRIIVVSQIIYMIQAMPKKVNMPNGCEKQNFCFEPGSNYPYEAIRSIMQKYKIDITSPDNEGKKETEIRINDEIEQLCSSNTKTDPIYYIKDTYGDVRYVVQSNNSANRLQKYHVVQCRDPGLLRQSPSFPEKDQIRQYNIRCVDRLVTVKFLVLTYDNQNVEMVTIKDGLPMACSCEYDPYPLLEEFSNDNVQYEYDNYTL